MPEDRAQTARPFVAGVNHRTSSLGLRDQLFIEDEAVPGVLAVWAPLERPMTPRAS